MMKTTTDNDFREEFFAPYASPLVAFHPGAIETPCAVEIAFAAYVEFSVVHVANGNAGSTIVLTQSAGETLTLAPNTKIETPATILLNKEPVLALIPNGTTQYWKASKSHFEVTRLPNGLTVVVAKEPSSCLVLLATHSEVKEI